MDEENEDCPKSYPSIFQKRMFWGAITAISIVIIAAISVGSIILGGKVLGYLQPILVPIAIAGIIAYLLEPIITFLRRKTRWRHRTCMYSVYAGFLLMVVLLIVSVVVPSFGQAEEFMKEWDTRKVQINELARKGINELQTRVNSPIARKYYDSGIDWISEEGAKVSQKIGVWTWERLMGAFGFFGYLLGLLLVPIYLFFFLKESHTIKNTWSDYLPLRASKFKDEVVDTLQEINQYLISFFRGQMVVSLIDGALVAIALSVFLQLPHALLIGVFLAILGLIPYIGNALVMIPAVLIAIVHFADDKTVRYPLDYDITANQVHLVDGKKKYISEVKQVTWVNVKSEGNQVLTGWVPYVAPGTTPVAAPETAETPAPDTTETDTETDAKPAPHTPAAAGKIMTVNLEKGGVIRGEIHSVIENGTLATYLTNAWSFLPNLWWYPLIVIGIFFTLQQINGLVTAPKIVGDSVGLHPLTVIFSVLFWSFLLGGLLGALLAVPLTASLKVLFRRYIWVKRIEPRVGPFGEKDDEEKAEPEAEPA